MSKLFEFGAGWVVASFLLFAAFMIVAVIVAAIYAWVKGGKAADEFRREQAERNDK